jgi:hypothetical protein
VSITRSSSRGATQTALGMLHAWMSVGCTRIGVQLNNWIKIASRWFRYTDILWCLVNKTLKMALPSTGFSSVVDMDISHDHFTSTTFVRPFLNISIHSYILQHGNVLSPSSARKVVCISTPLTPSAHKTLRCLSVRCKLNDKLTCSLLHG